MNKYFNKGLLYQWFNSSKMGILLGIIAWGIWVNSIIENNIIMTSNYIAYNFSNSFSTQDIFSYGILGIIFAGIHFMSQGINKRNNNMFLTSAPYTKKQIKYNEFICLMITLVVFIFVMLYINIMGYVRHYELMQIIDGYFTALGVEVIRMILFGTLGILILLIVDSMFSNTIMGIICMLTILPASCFFILLRLFSILDYIPAGNGKSIRYYLEINVFNSNHLYLLDSVSTRLIDKKYLITEIIIVLVIIAIALGIYYLIQRKYKLENNTKIFTSKINEKIVVIFSSLGVGAIASSVIMDKIYYEYSIEISPLKILSIDLLIIIVVSIITNKIINKIIKNIQ